VSTANPAAQGAERVRPRIGKYVINGRIGKGGMGQVYRGYDEALDREVAVKTLTIQGTLEEESRKRFEIEARAAAKLNHPNIVTVFELGQDRGIPYIAMELLPGWDLEGLLRSGESLLMQEKLDIIIQVCRGLQFAHEHHIVHRDIKPSNIRVLDDGSVKIMDFGIAKLANTHVTRTGMMVGTVHYMCPEQIQGQQVDGRSDVFAVGVILYELLAGRKPFEGEGPTDILFKIVQQATPALPDLGMLTPALQAIVGKTLAKSPPERYSSAARLADDLAELRGRVDASVSSGSEVLETIQAARQLVKQGKHDEGVTRLREMVERTPQSIDARRALRAACRDAARKSKPAEPEHDFPELTFQIAPTQMAATTLVPAPTQVAPAPTASAAGGKTLLMIGAAVLAFGIVAGILLMKQSSGSGDKETKGTAAGDTKEPQKPVDPPPGPGTAKTVTLNVVSEPAGASVKLDGQAVSGKTPLHVVTDPAKAHELVVSLEGHASRKVAIPVGASPDVKVSLPVLGPPGTLALSAPYSVEVSAGGRALGKGEGALSFGVPPGRQTVTISAPSVFLRMSREVEIQSGGTSRVELPGTGELNVQANPDNCRVFVDGVFVDYPPIFKKALVAGRHTVSFKWSDGPQKEETIDVEVGRPVYVTGRQD
jgi:tRNA A-37 threonylcarbamoyl transferase component Bud32